jgi:hypothetical protein
MNKITDKHAVTAIIVLSLSALMAGLFDHTIATRVLLLATAPICFWRCMVQATM